jgi:hypothetical protein
VPWTGSDGVNSSSRLHPLPPPQPFDPIHPNLHQVDPKDLEHLPMRAGLQAVGQSGIGSLDGLLGHLADEEGGVGQALGRLLLCPKVTRSPARIVEQAAGQLILQGAALLDSSGR